MGRAERMLRRGEGGHRWAAGRLGCRKIVLQREKKEMTITQPYLMTFGAGITKYWSLGGLSNKHLFLVVLEAGKLKVKVGADLVSDVF